LRRHSFRPFYDRASSPCIVAYIQPTTRVLSSVDVQCDANFSNTLTVLNFLLSVRWNDYDLSFVIGQGLHRKDWKPATVEHLISALGRPYFTNSHDCSVALLALSLHCLEKSIICGIQARRYLEIKVFQLVEVTRWLQPMILFPICSNRSWSGEIEVK
jgi:hypothetical protein